MASWELLAAFALATAGFAYFPGPALLYTAGLRRGEPRARERDVTRLVARGRLPLDAHR